jgi:Na+-translocating ferredoxin:NAD+ oxidoreductase subunit E
MSPESPLRRGALHENPISMLLIGLCPAAAVSARVIDSLWMSAGVVSVLILCRVCLAILDRASPDGEPPAAPVGRWVGALAISSLLTASFETLLLALAPAASASLGIYAPLIAVNCLVVGRRGAPRGTAFLRGLAEALGQGLGFAGCLLAIAVVRESLGAGTITLFPVGAFSGVVAVPGLARDPARALGAAGGGLLCLGYLAAAARLPGLWRRQAPEAEKDGKR